MTGEGSATRSKLDIMLAEAGLPGLTETESECFAVYLELILHWNDRTNLSSVRDPDGVLRRHFVECIACARFLPDGIKSVLDYGSGAGFPGIPIAICRPELAVTLAEAQNKKAAFLHEVVRALRLAAKVYAGRAETIGSTFDCVTLRAVDRMANAIETAVGLLTPNGYLAVMTTESHRDQVRNAAGPGFEWKPTMRLPASEERVLLLGSRSVSRSDCSTWNSQRPE
jgi:16S rRNA (guanine527-N7)-methyltransferase